MRGMEETNQATTEKLRKSEVLAEKNGRMVRSLKDREGDLDNAIMVRTVCLIHVNEKDISQNSGSK